MPQHKDLRVFHRIRPGHQNEPAEHPHRHQTPDLASYTLTVRHTPGMAQPNNQTRIPPPQIKPGDTIPPVALQVPKISSGLVRAAQPG
jgi:hypothetical protein